MNRTAPHHAATTPLVLLPALLAAVIVVCTACNQRTAAPQLPAIATGGAPSAQAAERHAQAIDDEISELMMNYKEHRDSASYNRAMALTDSIELADTTQEAQFQARLNRAQLLAMAGHMRKAMELQESLLPADPNNLTRLQFFAAKYMMEGMQDSVQHYAERALQVCDRIIRDSALVANVGDVDQAIISKMNVYQMLNDRVRAHEASDLLARRHYDDPSYQLTPEEFNAEYDEVRAQILESLRAWRDDN